MTSPDIAPTAPDLPQQALPARRDVVWLPGVGEVPATDPRVPDLPFSLVYGEAEE